MLGITFYSDNRFERIENLTEEQKDALCFALYQNYKKQGIEEEAIDNVIKYVLNKMTVDDLEKARVPLTVHYVERDRDFSLCDPVDLSSKEKALPLLDALARGDFELAKHLTPVDKRLCGFEYVNEETVETNYFEYAAYFEDIAIKAGIYPVFAEKFGIDERYKGPDGFQYTNALKDFQGLSVYKYGTYFRGNPPIEKPYEGCHITSPYTHAVAKIGLDKTKGSIQMIAPFKAEGVNFYSTVFNEDVTTYKIIDSDLEDKVLINPMLFRGGISSMISDGIFRVERLRISVTQGEAAVYCNGHKIIQYGDEMWLRCKNGTLSNGIREIPDSLSPGNYGDIFGGWGSIRTDYDFVRSAILQFPKDVEKALKNDRKMSLDEQIYNADNKKDTFEKDVKIIEQER